MENQENVEQFYKKATRKAKTNLVWFGIFSIVMLFAGLTSAYIVQKGDIFWVKFPLPVGLWISTAIILVSSITMILAVKTAKSKNNKKTMLFLIITLLLGIAFTVSQFSAWNKLIDNGYRLTEKIFHPDTEEYLMNGEYGKDFTIEFQGNPLIQENDGFYFWGEQAIKIDKEEYTELKNENPRSVPIGDVAAEILERASDGKDKNDFIFQTKLKIPKNAKRLRIIDRKRSEINAYFITTTTISTAFKEMAEDHGLPNITTHGLRHTFASHFVMNGGSITALQKILGHKKIDNTMIYAHLSKAHMDGVRNLVQF